MKGQSAKVSSSYTKKAPKGSSGQLISPIRYIPAQSARENSLKRSTTFFHPDCTVGSGISPDHANLHGSWALPPVGNKRISRYHPAPKVILLLFFIITRVVKKVNN